MSPGARLWTCRICWLMVIFVDPAIVWQVVMGDLPKLETQIRGILDGFSDEE